MKTARRLAKLRFSRVDLVEKGANQHAHVTLLKNEAGAAPVEKGQGMECPSCGKRLPLGYEDCNNTLPNFCGECGAEIKLTATGGNGVEKSMKNDKQGEPTVEQLKADLAKAQGDLAASQEKVTALEKAATPPAPAAPAADDPTAVLKSITDPAARALVEKSLADAAKATTEAAEAKAAVLKMQDSTDTRAFEDRAAAITGVPGFDRVAGGRILKALSRIVEKSADGKTVLDEVETILKAAAEAIKKGALFNENGITGAAPVGGTDEFTQLTAMAKARVEKGLAKTDDEGLTQVLQTPEGSALYEKHAERQRAVRRQAPEAQ